MPNDFTSVIPKLLAQGLMALREVSIMPKLVNREYETIAGQRGSTIDVPIPSAVVVSDVTPAATAPTTADQSPTSVPITLDKWKEAPFYMTDKDLLEVVNGTLPMCASAAIKAIANQVDADIFALYKGVYGYTGTAGTTPFGGSTPTTSDAIQLRKVLTDQLAPNNDRRIILDTSAEANALGLRALQDASARGSSQTITEGTIGRALGFDWYASQNVPTHTASAAAAATVTMISKSAVGAKSVTLKVSTSTAAIKKGDIITFAGHSQTYAVGADATLDSTGVAVTISPGLKVAVDGSGTAVNVTFKASHVVNLGFHRDAFAFASRPLAGDELSRSLGLGNFQSAVDPVSGLVLRLEITREHKRLRFSYDILYGCALVRPELASRLAG